MNEAPVVQTAGASCFRAEWVWCPEPDLNRHAMLVAADFKSAVSTDFTIGAWVRSVRPLARGGRCPHVVKTHISLIGEFFLV